MAKLPFSILPPKLLAKISPLFNSLSVKLLKKNAQLEDSLKKANFSVSAKEYLGMCLASTFFNFLILSLFGILLSLKISLFGEETLKNIIGMLLISFAISSFVFFQQISYPRLKAYAKIKDIERNLLPALQHILIQINSGAPLFEAIVGVSSSDYGGVSEEFKRAVRKINAGKNQINALEEVAQDNPSPYFRRAIWQITTGMKTGSDVSNVLKNTINDLSEEQVIQIQKYGSQLNPLAMFYMLVAVIIPSLGITFIMILSAMANISSSLTKLIFWGLLSVVFFFQIMFLGIIKSRRPNLLE
jgi:pilus assembly protein TadC